MVASMNIQVFGTKKCKETRKTQRWFKERGIRFHALDLSQKAMSLGEIRSVAAAVGGIEELIDRDGTRYLDRGLQVAAPTGPRIEAMLAEDPLLLRTPITRAGKKATIGYDPETWKKWIE